ncbi:MAG: right-handed parallel beta-helix repeat-containing protein [Sedimentisphaerales bacterium]|nr:right-handed parallel beta-helix repeat-containing protein [Sedimentisphaerales bacterium]
MKTRKITGIMVLFVLVYVGIAGGTTYYVSTDGNDLNDGLSWATAFATIQKGINATNCDAVEVNEGTYYGSIDFNGIPCTVTGTDPNNWDVVNATVIDGNGATSGVLFNLGEGSGSILTGFTVEGAARGITCGSNTSPIINKCIIRNNNERGMFCGGAPSIINNKIYDNGIYNIYLQSSTAGTIVRNNLIYGCNYGIRMVSPTEAVTISNDTIVGSEIKGVFRMGGSSQTITNCIVWDCNDDLSGCNATYSCIQDGDAGTGNISSNPCFVNPDGNDFHLASNSPCIDSGDPEGSYAGQSDIDGDERVIIIYADMGADETTPPNTHWWKLDETSGTTAYDSVGNSDGGFNGDDPNWGPGLIGGAVDLKGVNDYFSVASLNNAYNNSSVFTIAGWFKTDQSTGNQTIIGQWYQESNWYYGWQVIVYNNKVVARFAHDDTNVVDITGTSDVNDDEWHQFAIVHNGTNIVVYVDGLPEKTGLANFDAYDTKFRIGDGSAGSGTMKGGPFNGIIDDIMIFNRVLTDDEVFQLYIGGLNLKAFNRTQDKWYTSIQSAIDDSNDGDVIEAVKTTHLEALNFGERDITLCGVDPNDFDVVAKTIINGDGEVNVIAIGSGCGATLRGLTITGGENGIYCSGGNPVISNCIISNNSNTGVYVESSTASIKNCLIYDNSAGMVFEDAEEATVRNNTIVDNTSYGVQVSSGSGPAISNCILWNNDDDLSGCSVTYSCIQDGNSGTGNISSYPYFADYDGNDFHLTWNSPCIDLGDPNGDYEGQSDIDGQPRVIWDRVDMGADELEGYSLFDMEVESVTGDSNEVTVITTGATYVLTQTGMDMYRRIDPNTNDYDDANDGKGRQVAELSFDSNIGPLDIEVNRAGLAVIQSDKATFEFYSDSFFTITAKEEFTYTHVNLITNAPWNAPLNPEQRELDRIWTDGYGGSLHAVMSETTVPDLNSNSENSTTMDISTGDTMAHMVYPTKKFDLEGFYGVNSRPHVRANAYIGAGAAARNPINLQKWKDDGYGVIFLTNYIYSNSYKPELLESNPDILGYNVKSPNDLKSFVELAHEYDYKVITYLWWHWNYWIYPDGHPNETEHQDMEVTLQWMREFQKEYGLDGWFIDSSKTGYELINNYHFFRQLRTDVGNEGIIYHHDSIDVWDDWRVYSGLRAIMLNAYVNYQCTGESETGTMAEINSPNDAYLRFYASGYGMSQAYSSTIRLSSGCSAITEKEKKRVMGENLHGTDVFRTEPDINNWPNFYKPAYDKRKNSYNDPNISFDPDVDWPIDPETGWFRNAEDVNVQFADGNVVIYWTTDSNADSYVYYTSDGKWWVGDYNEVFANIVGSSEKVMDHSVTINGLEPSFYEFRIMSSNGEPNVVKEVIWSYMSSFAVPSPAEQASNPSPANEATDVSVTTTLSWTAGERAETHDVYFSTDWDDVNDANTSSPEYMGSVDVNSYDPCGLDYSIIYYWRIDEKNGGGTTKGDVWSFTTAEPPAVEIIGSWGTGLTHAKESGNNRVLILIAHAEENGTTTLNSVTYGGQSMTKVVDRNYYSGSGSYAYTAAYVLNETGVAAADNNNFVVTWNNTPTASGYSSVFLSNVDQAALAGASASNGSTSNPIATASLSTGDGDMVILAATCGNEGTYTLNNGFTEGTDQTMGDTATGVTGHKPATGAAETPNANYSGTINRQVIIGFVVRAVGSQPPVNILGPWATNLTHTKEAGNERALVFIAHGENTSTMDLNSVTYGGKSMTKVVDKVYSNGNPTYYAYVAAFILDEADIADANSDGTFELTWNGTTPTVVGYASVFLNNVDQGSLFGAYASNGGTSDPITTTSLATNAGDMVILAATCGNNGSYEIWGNSFTEDTDQSIGQYGFTGVAGHKAAAGANEVPSANFSGSVNRQVIIGFVVQGSTQ